MQSVEQAQSVEQEQFRHQALRTLGQAVRGAKVRGIILAAIVLALLAITSDAATPGVARLSLLQGDVSVLKGGDQQWSQAALNAPLISGDELYIDQRGRAELEFNGKTVARLAGGTDLTLQEVDSNGIRLELRSGTLSLTTVGRHFLPTEIDLPNMSARPERSGTLRLDIVDATHTSATVRGGRAVIFTPRGSVEVTSGKQIQVQGSASDPAYQLVEAGDRDDWDNWVHRREERVEDARSYRYMNGAIDGGEDLDAYGNWVNVPGYGSCWQPVYTVSDWSPYHYGRWVWTPYYGWTWVSYEPWGWAPYHYGRWMYWRSGWVWWPGPSAIWAPAYVAFVVGSPTASIAFAFGDSGIGWVPLAPFEPFFGFSQVNFIRHVTNITNITNVTNVVVAGGGSVATGPGPIPTPVQHLRNLTAPGGVMMMSAHAFAHERADEHAIVVPRADRTRLRSVRGTAPVAPTLASLHALPGARGLALPPSSLRNITTYAPTARGRVLHAETAAPLPPLPRARLANTALSLATAQRAIEHARTVAGLPATIATPSLAGAAGNAGSLRFGGASSGAVVERASGNGMASAHAGGLMPASGAGAENHSGWRQFGEPAAPPASAASVGRQRARGAPAIRPTEPAPATRPIEPAAMRPTEPAPARGLSGFRHFDGRPVEAAPVASGRAARVPDNRPDNQPENGPDAAVDRAPRRPEPPMARGALERDAQPTPQFQNHPFTPPPTSDARGGEAAPARGGWSPASRGAEPNSPAVNSGRGAEPRMPYNGTMAPRSEPAAPRGEVAVPRGSYSAPSGAYSAPHATYSAPRSEPAPRGDSGARGNGTSSGRAEPR